MGDYSIWNNVTHMLNLSESSEISSIFSYSSVFLLIIRRKII